MLFWKRKKYFCDGKVFRNRSEIYKIRLHKLVCRLDSAAQLLPQNLPALLEIFCTDLVGDFLGRKYFFERQKNVKIRS